jgi:hypothetical protein
MTILLAVYDAFPPSSGNSKENHPPRDGIHRNQTAVCAYACIYLAKLANPSGTKEEFDRPASATHRRFHLSKNLPTIQLYPLDRLRYCSLEQDTFLW